MARRGVIDAAPRPPRAIRISDRRLGVALTARAKRRRPTVHGMGSIVATEPTPKDKGPDRPSHPDPGPRGHIGWIVAGSLATGLVAALLLALAPFIPAEEMLSLAQSCADSPWAGRCWLCSRCGSPISRSDGPRLLHWSWDWAAFSWWGFGPLCTRCSTGCGPRHAGVGRLDDHPRPSTASEPGGRWLLYPVIVMLALASIGGGYETLRKQRMPRPT